MALARPIPPKCPNHPTTDMVLVGEKALAGHEKSEVHGIALWICPLETYGTNTILNYKVKGDPGENNG